MSKSDVSEMVKLCTGLGLRVNFETGGGHYTVRDPDSDAKLFYISSTPSDTNFKYEIARHLRRLGLLKGNLKFGRFKTITRKKKYGPVDMVALRKAQVAAEAAGERIPLLSDIEGQTEFFRRSTSGHKTDGAYCSDAQQEAIDNMALKLSPRAASTKARLRKTLEERGMKQVEFVELAMEVGIERDLRTWPKVQTGQTILNKFIKNDDITMQLWGINLIEATLDKIDGLLWVQGGNNEPPTGTDDDLMSAKDIKDIEDEIINEVTRPEVQYVTEETLLNILGNWVPKIEDSIMRKIQEDVFEGAPSNGNTLRDKYAEKLLALVENGVSEAVLDRLDKLVGLEV